MTLELASDQQMARLMHVPEIAARKELTTHGISKTPLRYYCLHEAESHGGKLGPVGCTIVAGTLLRLLSLDPDSLLCSAYDFKPWTTLGASKAGNFSLGHMLACVEAGRDAIAHADDLITGQSTKEHGTELGFRAKFAKMSHKTPSGEIIFHKITPQRHIFCK